MLPNQSDLDQALAGMRDVLPASWRSLYDGCREQGFDTIQAFELVQTYILAQNPHGIHPPDGRGPDAPD